MIPFQNYLKGNVKNDILSGLIVAVALVPEAIAFAMIAELSPIVGLYGAFILGLITALIGGKPGMISGATGAVAVVLVALVLEAKALLTAQGLSGDALAFGVLQYVTLAAIIAGLFQIGVGLLKLGKFIRLVPQPALFGFVNGLAIVIAMSQFKFLENANTLMITLVIATMAIMFFLPKVTKQIPAGLFAIVVITAIVYFFHFDVVLIGTLNTLDAFKNMPDLAQYKGQLPTFHIPDTILSGEAILTVLPTAIIVAMVGLIESLLTLSVLDEMSGVRGSGNRECIAQGTGNIACGMFGAMPGCAMIGQSVINYTSGGLGRLSGITAAVGLLLLVITLTDVLAIIPIAVLVGIMFMVSIGTFEWSSANRIFKMPREDAFVMVVVTVITVLVDLAIAVISGVIISALVFAWKQARITAHTHTEEDGTKVYTLQGPLFFGSIRSFYDAFSIEMDPPKVVIDFKFTRVMDSSAVEAIDTLTKKYEEVGSNLKLRHLSKDCKNMLQAAGPYCTFEIDDPTYKVAVNY
ncbi:MAG: sulfate permease [Sulfuricurvum sp. PC08-66]|nr:MAG: sulfate permease [Sulfuricurvum sp. PC08-66]